MRPQQLAALIAALAILALALIVAPFAVPNNSLGRIVRPKLGLDIQGGARVVLEAQTEKLPTGQKWDEEARTAVLNTIRNRVDANGVSEPVILPKGERQFVVELPGIDNEKQLLEQLQNTAQLEFYYSPDWRTQRNESLNIWRYDIRSEGGEGNRRESFVVYDAQTKETFRDRFHINRELAQLLAKAQTGDKVSEVTIPAALADYNAVQGRKTLRLSPEDAKKLDALATEAQNFNGFLSSARLEMTGRDLTPGRARAGFSPNGGGGAVVSLQFNSEGTRKFSNFTRDHTSEILMIYLDGRILMAPNINEPILTGEAQISPFATVKEAQLLSDYLNGGALPVPLQIIQQQSVEATLGREAVRNGLIAGLVGIGAVIVFMVTYYLLPGAIACAALVLYTLFTYALFVLVGVTFTLPGIAGFILSVGMAVDANVLIFERTKEELREGRPLRRAIESGFSRAFSAILDSNVCTAVTSLLLYNFGTGPVRGFAMTLLLGVAVSMFTAITVTRTLLLLIVDTPAGKNLSSWGVNRNWRPNFDTVRRRYTFYGLSTLLIVPGLIFVMMGGLKYGVEFTGGSELTLRFSAPVTRSEVEKAVGGLGLEEPTAQIAGDNTVIVRIPRQQGEQGGLTTERAAQVTGGIQKAFPNQTVTQQEFGFIGSSISQELRTNALLAVALSSLFIVLYLAFRFAIGGFANGLKFGIAAILAMLHDVFLLIGAFAILGHFLNWKVDSLFVTALLTVIGFSVHDTIVIFDRIRENLKTHGNRMEFGALVNESINETFTRSINTSLTVVLTLVALLLLGGPVIRPLNAALLIGIISGTYSSIFNAAQIVVDWQRRFGGKTALAPSGGGSGEGGPASRPSITPRAERPATERPVATPRPIQPVTPNGSTPTAAPRPIPTLTPTPQPDANGTTGTGNSTPPPGSDGNNGSEAAPRPANPLPQGPPRPRRRRM